MMSLKSKHELLEMICPRYLKANKIDKQKSWMSLRLQLGTIANMRSAYSKTKGKFKTT